MNKSGINSIKLFIFLVCLGIALLAAGIIIKSIFNNDELGSRLINFGTGFSSSILAAAAVRFIMVKRNPNIIKEQEIKEKDERYIKIREKSAYNVFFITLIGLVVVCVVYVCLNLKIATWITIGLLWIHIISIFIFIHRYNKKM